MKSIGVLIPTLNAAGEIGGLLASLRRQSEPLPLLIVDSSSADGTAELARAAGAQVIVIPRGEFSHGGTRERFRKTLGTDLILMLTQDARIAQEDLAARLGEPLRSGMAAVSYARQLPREGAGFAERFDRGFNYPAQSCRKTLADAPRLGSFAFACSNSCALWDNAALDAVGGFPPVAHNEDTYATARLLRAGYANAYVAQATVVHSHAFTLRQLWDRFYAVGHERTRGAAEFAGLLRDGARGREYARALLAAAARECPWQLPRLLCELGIKFAAYRSGVRRAQALIASGDAERHHV